MRVTANKITCSICKAKPGEQCKTFYAKRQGVPMTQPHFVRISDACDVEQAVNALVA